jgi:glycosyltransferase involved in cell wall biosynthesis
METLESVMKKPIRVVFFHRKPRGQNFSVEILFEQIRKNLPSYIKPIISTASHTSNGFWKRFYMAAEAAFRQKSGDINHITGDVNFIGFFFKKKKTILTILDVGFMNHPNQIARWFLRFFWIILPVKRAAVITTISQATKDELLKHVTCDPNKIKVVYVPVSEKFTKAPCKAFNKDCPVLLQIGTKANKNVAGLIEAVRGINCHLDIVGGLSEELHNKLKAYGIKYSLSSQISEDQILTKYQQCDIVTFMSTYEGFGMPIVEANIIGKPVVTSNILSMPEVAGNAAHLVDPFDIEDVKNGILKVIGDDTYRNQLIENGYENAKKFAVEKIVKDYCRVYQEILNGESQSMINF